MSLSFLNSLISGKKKTGYSGGGGGGGGGGGWGSSSKTSFSAPKSSSGSGYNNDLNLQVQAVPQSTIDALNNYGKDVTYGNQSQAYGYGYGSGSGGAAPAPDTTALQNAVRSKIQAIQNAYSQMQGNYQNYANDQTNQYLNNYKNQIQGLTDSYGSATNGTQGVYGSKGLSDSSFLGNALDEQGRAFNDNLNSINQDKQSKLAGIGQTVAQQLAGIKAAQDQYNQYLPHLGEYAANDLTSLDSTLGGALPGIQAQAAGVGTNQQFINQLAQYAPAVNQGSSQLQGMLQKLVASNAPTFAKNTIAKGLINSTSGADPGYYQDYFQKLLAGQAQGA